MYVYFWEGIVYGKMNNQKLCFSFISENVDSYFFEIMQKLSMQFQ